MDFRPALDPYGTWQDDPSYGSVWSPNATGGIRGESLPTAFYVKVSGLTVGAISGVGCSHERGASAIVRGIVTGLIAVQDSDP